MERDPSPTDRGRCQQVARESCPQHRAGAIANITARGGLLQTFNGSIFRIQRMPKATTACLVEVGCTYAPGRWWRYDSVGKCLSRQKRISAFQYLCSDLAHLHGALLEY